MCDVIHSTADIARRHDFMAGLVGEAGALAMSYFRQPARLNVETKGLQDFVTAADRAVEDFIVSRLGQAFPEDGVIGEERGAQGSSGGAIWIIDPIDGTANFARGLPFWCISVALLVGRQIVSGFIHDPVTGETFSALRGKGALCDGQAIRVAQTATPELARINIGFTFRCDPQISFSAIERLVASRCDWSRLGSAALGLAYVASGRLDGYWAPHVNAWDVAAGICLVDEAGGWVSDFLAGDGLAKGNPILAAAPGMAEFFKSRLQDLAPLG